MHLWDLWFLVLFIYPWLESSLTHTWLDPTSIAYNVSKSASPCTELSPNSKSTSPPFGKTTFTCFPPAPRHPVTLAKGGRGAFNLQICWQLLFFYFLSIQFTYFPLIYTFSDNSYFFSGWEFPSSEITFVQGITLVGKLNPRFPVLLLNFSFINKYFPKILHSGVEGPPAFT